MKFQLNYAPPPPPSVEDVTLVVSVDELRLLKTALKAAPNFLMDGAGFSPDFRWRLFREVSGVVSDIDG